MANYSNRYQENIDEIYSLVGNNGGLFATEDEVREFFTVEMITKCFSGECSQSQDELDDLADLVIEYRETDASNLWE
jgi:hypothetical protein